MSATVSFSSRMSAPKADVIAAYIGFIGETLYLFETNEQNKSIRQFALSEQDIAIPVHLFAEAFVLKGQAFNQVKVYQHPSYIEYYHVVSNTKLKKQAFWVKRPQDLMAA